jgi:hypothetical protein
MKMKKFLIIFSVLFFAYSWHSIADDRLDPRVDEKYVDNLIRKTNEIQLRLRGTYNPEKRSRLIMQFVALQEQFYKPEVRVELIRRKHPDIAKKIIQYRQIPIEQRKEFIKAEMNRVRELNPYDLAESESKWPFLDDEERKEVCNAAYNNCQTKNEILQCRFLIDKCRNYLAAEKYSEVDSRF